MNEVELIKSINTDLASVGGRGVVYLEGKSDVSIFFSLLGVRVSLAFDRGTHESVLVRGLVDDTSGSGRRAVEDRVLVARNRGLKNVFGIIDGDGSCDYPTSAAAFEGPHDRRIWKWRAYSIENLLAKTPWPSSLGPAPDWSTAFLELAPYVAKNRIHLQLKTALGSMRLLSFESPVLDVPRKKGADVLELLRKDKHRVTDYDLEAEFEKELARLEIFARTDTNEAHCATNGKWLVDVIAAEHAKLTPPEMRERWCTSAVATGGLREVKDLWQRLTGAPP